MSICPICNEHMETPRCEACGCRTIVEERLPTSHALDLVGSVLEERYRIEALLGEGGMGRVYRAVQLSVDRDVAIKVMHPELARDLHQVRRFHREALASSKLSHPNSIEIYDFGQSSGGILYLVMEYLEGESLEARLARVGRLPLKEIVPITLQILAALSEAHDKGIVHRDLKPDNIFLARLHGERDFVKVLDFGIAKLVQQDDGRPQLTSTGVVVGTPFYTSPEQAASAPVDCRADLYSLGVILFEMLTGSKPFMADSSMKLLMKHISEPPPSIRSFHVAVDLPPELITLVHGLLAKAPETRPPSADAVARRIEAIPAELVKGRPLLVDHDDASKGSMGREPSLASAATATVGDDRETAGRSADPSQKAPPFVWGGSAILLAVVAGIFIFVLGHRPLHLHPLQGAGVLMGALSSMEVQVAPKGPALPHEPPEPHGQDGPEGKGVRSGDAPPSELDPSFEGVGLPSASSPSSTLPKTILPKP